MPEVRVLPGALRRFACICQGRPLRTSPKPKIALSSLPLPLPEGYSVLFGGQFGERVSRRGLIVRLIEECLDSGRFRFHAKAIEPSVLSNARLQVLSPISGVDHTVETSVSCGPSRHES